MSWAKGVQAGYSPKAECLKLAPGSTCHKVRWQSITGYIVYRGKDHKAIASASTARRAWELAGIRIQTWAKK